MYNYLAYVWDPTNPYKKEEIPVRAGSGEQARQIIGERMKLKGVKEYCINIRNKGKAYAYKHGKHS